MTFLAALLCAGLRPRDIVADGRWYRCATDDHPRKRNGAYKLELGGDQGWYRNWATDAAPQPWGDGRSAKPQDPRRVAESRAKAREMRLAGIRAARDLWASGKPYRAHPYIERKGLTSAGCHNLRTWHGEVWCDVGPKTDTWLMAPMYWRDRLTSVQRIAADGTKRQVKGAPQRGASLLLGRERWSVTVFVEGLATGLAVYQCMPAARVVVCYMADNLMPVIRDMRPAGAVVIAADNDHKTEAKIGTNPGVAKAQAAADLIHCGVVWPAGIEGTDFADALTEWGERGPRRIERIINSGAVYVPTG